MTNDTGQGYPNLPCSLSCHQWAGSTKTHDTRSEMDTLGVRQRIRVCWKQPPMLRYYFLYRYQYYLQNMPTECELSEEYDDSSAWFRQFWHHGLRASAQVAIVRIAIQVTHVWSAHTLKSQNCKIVLFHHHVTNGNCARLYPEPYFAKLATSHVLNTGQRRSIRYHLVKLVDIEGWHFLPNCRYKCKHP